MTSLLPWRHALIVFSVILVWGSNFVVIKQALAQFPPLLFAALRFVFALLPAIFFFKRPAVPLWHFAAYGALIGVGQFGLLFTAMNGHISPGLASVVMQSQVFFTILLAVWLEGERVQPMQMVALVCAGVGIGVIAAHTDGSTTILGLILSLAAALCWAGGNAVARHSGRVNTLAYVVWASLFSMPPLLLLSFVFEGWTAISAAVLGADIYAWGGVFWQAYANALFGYACWSWLLARHPAAIIAPTTLLVPVVGLGSAVWILNEPLPLWKIAAALLIVGGVGLNMIWPKRAAVPEVRPTSGSST